MLVKVIGLLVQVIPYKESSHILKVYTQSQGLQSYMVSGVKGPKSAIKPAHLQLLNLLELEVYQKQSNSIHRIKELKCNPPLVNLHTDMERIAVSLFIAEVLSKTLNEENQPDESLFDFLFNLVQFVDITQSTLSWLPQHFLLRLSAHLGFSPFLVEGSENRVFSLKEGVFIDEYRSGPDSLTVAESELLIRIMKTGIADLPAIPSNRQLRNHLLEALLRYFSYHVPGFREIQSHAILASLW